MVARQAKYLLPAYNVGPGKYQGGIIRSDSPSSTDKREPFPSAFPSMSKTPRMQEMFARILRFDMLRSGDGRERYQGSDHPDEVGGRSGRTQ
jgi:hypothetical protein